MIIGGTVMNKLNISRKFSFKVFLILLAIVLGVCIYYVASATHNTNYLYGKITYDELTKIDNDNIIQCGLTNCITHQTLIEKGYILSSEQTLSEANNSVWYDCKKMNGQMFLAFQNFSIELSNNNDLLGYNFYYKPTSIENEDLETVVSIYCGIANTDRFVAVSGESFSYDEIKKISLSKFNENGSVFKIVKTSLNQSISLFLEINNVGEVFFYGYCGMNNPET